MKLNKSTLASLGLVATLFLAGACAPDASQDTPNTKLSLLSNGPDLPEECLPCWDQFQECFDEGSDLDVCADGIVVCTQECQAPPPPPECLHCAAGFEACAIAAGDDGNIVGDCAAGFEGCLRACESDCQLSDQGCEPGHPGDPTDPQPPIGEEQCEIAFNECFDDLWGTQSGNDNPEEAAHVCDELLQQCYEDCPPHDGGGTEPDPRCDDAVWYCENGGAGDPSGQFDNVSCEEILNYCSQDPGVPPGDDGDPNTPPSDEDPNTPPDGQDDPNTP